VYGNPFSHHERPITEIDPSAEQGIPDQQHQHGTPDITRTEEVEGQNEDQELPPDERDQHGYQIDAADCRFSSKEILICFEVAVIKTWTRLLLNRSS
jgi:hypothetical protein